MSNNNDFIKTDCRGAQERFLDLFEGNLHSTQHKSVKAHLDTCPECHGKFEQMRTAHQFLAAELPGTAEELDVPPYLAMRIKHKMSHTSQAWWQKPAATRTWAAAAAIMLAALGTSIYLRGTAPAESAGPSDEIAAESPSHAPFTFFIITSDETDNQHADVQPHSDVVRRPDFRYRQMQQTPKVHSPVLMVQRASFDREM